MSPTSTKPVKADASSMFVQCLPLLSVGFDIFAMLYCLFVEDSYKVLPAFSLLVQISHLVPIVAVLFNKKSGAYAYHGSFYAPTSIRNQWKVLGVSALLAQSLLTCLMLVSDSQHAGVSRSVSNFHCILLVFLTINMLQWTTRCAYPREDLAKTLIKDIQGLR